MGSPSWVGDHLLFIFISPASSTAPGTSWCLLTDVGTKMNWKMQGMGVQQKRGQEEMRLGRWVQPAVKDFTCLGKEFGCHQNIFNEEVT